MNTLNPASICEQISAAQFGSHLSSRVRFYYDQALCVCVCVYLDDEGLVLEAWCHAQHAHVGRFVNEVLDAMEHSTTGGRDTSMDSSLADGLSCHTRMGVDILHTNKEKIRPHTHTHHRPRVGNFFLFF